MFGLVPTAALVATWSKGVVALDMTCASREAWHLWLGHGLTFVIVVGLAWLAGRRWLSP